MVLSKDLDRHREPGATHSRSVPLSCESQQPACSSGGCDPMSHEDREGRACQLGMALSSPGTDTITASPAVNTLRLTVKEERLLFQSSGLV